jgi:hypothetical protein
MRDRSIKDAMPFEDTLKSTTSWELLYNSLRANLDGRLKVGLLMGWRRRKMMEMHGNCKARR